MEGFEIHVNDKLGHTLAYLTLMISAGISFVQRKKLFLASLLFMYGLMIEFIQGLIPGRTSSVYDLLANSTGIILGFAILSIFGGRIHYVLKRIGFTK
jgi:VanZ family protein